MADKKFDAPPKDIQKQLEGIKDTVQDRIPHLRLEIKGWWIWADTSNYSPTAMEETFLQTMSFFKAKNGKNAGNWYYKHPMSPNGRRRYNNKSSHGGNTNKSNLVNENSKTTQGKDTDASVHNTPRQILEFELTKVRDMMTRDSGENYINLRKMEADIIAKITALEGDKPEPPKPPEPEASEEALQELRQQAQENQEPEPKEEISSEDADDILAGLFD